MNDKEVLENQSPETPEEQAASNETDLISNMQNEIDRLKEEAARNYDQHLRSLADAENIRKRALREKEEYLKYASLPVIRKVLNVLDDLERALVMSEANRDYDALYKGLEMIAKRMADLVQEEGVQTIEALGQPFDPQFHQPLTVEASSEHPENTVIEELQKGYVLHGRVIRPSLVKVSN